jgi:hypothetical protein
MTIPKIQFKIANLDSTLELANKTLNTQEKEIILSEYPVLKQRLQETTEDLTKITNKFFRHLQKEIKGKMTKTVNTFQKTWNSIEEEVTKTISEIIELEWPKHLQNITANINFLPLSTEYNKTDQIDIYYKSNIQEMKNIILNKLSYLLYNEKHKQIFKKQENKKTLIIEILINPIIEDKKIQKITRLKPQNYTKYNTIIINDNLLQNHIKKIYKEKTSFEDYIKKSEYLIKKTLKKSQGKLSILKSR